MKELLTFFKTLSDPTRLRIIVLLLGKDLCVCELTFVLKMSQSRISHQLRILRDAGLVEDKRDGKWIIYGIPRGVHKILRPLLSLFGRDKVAESAAVIRDLRNLKICLKEDVRRKRGPVKSPKAVLPHRAKTGQSKPAGRP
jgi:ArsR family transcriptional regulator, arsenate/arsenite/antimonite-responsive transcriptional repressor